MDTIYESRNYYLATRLGPENALTIENRLYHRAKHGADTAYLWLYPSQEKRLEYKLGCTVSRVSPKEMVTNGKYTPSPGQHSCKISWRYVIDKNSFAQFLREIAAEKNESLRRQMANPNEKPIQPPYEQGGWLQ